MDTALPIHDYLPVYYNNAEEDKYIAFLWESFLKNHESKHYEFANLAFHLLYMSFTSFVVWRLRFARKNDFEKAMVGFQNEVENKLFNATTPFNFFENLKESAIFRFIKLLGCTNKEIGDFARFVKFRNRIAHPSGTTNFNDELAFSDHIEEVLKQLNLIQSRCERLTLDLFKDFLVGDSGNAEIREFPDEKTEIDVNLIGKYYLSTKDIEVCLKFDLNELNSHPQLEAAQVLFESFSKAYKVVE